jgi:hypothetical protein
MSEPSCKQRLRRARDRAARRLEKQGWDVYAKTDSPYCLIAVKGNRTRTFRVDIPNPVK